jgi:hypothetical protein
MSTYTYDSDNEHCPKCGESWQGECPKDPWWIEWHCTNDACKYAVGEHRYTGERMVIKDSLTEQSLKNELQELVGSVLHAFD